MCKHSDYPRTKRFKTMSLHHSFKLAVAKLYLVWQLGSCKSQTSLTKNVGLHDSIWAEWNDTMVAVNLSVLEAAIHVTSCNMCQHRRWGYKDVTSSKNDICPCANTLTTRERKRFKTMSLHHSFKLAVANLYLVWQLGSCKSQTSLTKNVGLHDSIWAEWNDTMVAVAVNLSVLEAAIHVTSCNMCQHRRWGYKDVTSSKNDTGPCANTLTTRERKRFKTMSLHHSFKLAVANLYLVWQLGSCKSQTSLTKNVGLHDSICAEWNDTMVAVNRSVLKWHY